jgi:hypothetical protein
MAEILESYYTELLGTQPLRDMTINFTELGISPHDLSTLDLPFTEEEVWATDQRTAIRQPM